MPPQGSTQPGSGAGRSCAAQVRICLGGSNIVSAYTSPPDRMAFYRQVWAAVRRIPKGRVATYGQIAAAIPPPAGVALDTYAAFGARWVGGAMADCPPDVPWQRVVNAQGRSSLRGQTGKERQRWLLEAEGIAFDERGRIDLERFGITRL